MGKFKTKEERNEYMSKLFSGKNNPFYGKKHNSKTLLKIPLFKKDHIPWNKDKKGEYSLPKHTEEQNKRISQAKIGHIVSQDIRDKISKTLKDMYKNRKHPLTGIPKSEKHRENMSKSKKGKPTPWMKDRVMSEETKNKIRIARMNQKDPYNNTKPERFMESILTLNNIPFKKQKLINSGRNFWHRVDFFIEPNICIEVDGVYFHSLNVNRDKIINEYLLSNNYKLIRITDEEIYNDSLKCLKRIQELIENDSI